MSRVTQINKGVYIQQDTSSPAQALPSNSVTNSMLDPTVRGDIARPKKLSDYVVGLSADTLLGYANYTDLIAAMAAAPTGSTIHILPGTYTLGTVTVTYPSTKNLKIVGSGYQTIINGNLTLDLKYWSLQDFQLIGNLTLPAGSSNTNIFNCWHNGTFANSGTNNSWSLFDISNNVQKNRVTQLYNAVVGSASQVSQGVATHSNINTAISSLSAGGTMLVLSTYTPSSTAISLSTRINIIGQGQSTVLTTGAFTIASGTDFVSISNCKFGGNLTIAGSGCYVQGWQATGLTISNTGSANALVVIQE